MEVQEEAFDWGFPEITRRSGPRFWLRLSKGISSKFSPQSLPAPIIPVGGIRRGHERLISFGGAKEQMARLLLRWRTRAVGQFLADTALRHPCSLQDAKRSLWAPKDPILGRQLPQPASGTGGGGDELSPISPPRSLRQGAGESGAEICCGRALPASVAAPGIAPAPAPAPQRVWLSLYAGAREHLFLSGWWEEEAREGGSSPVTHKQSGWGSWSLGRGSGRAVLMGWGATFAGLWKGGGLLCPPPHLPSHL